MNKNASIEGICRCGIFADTHNLFCSGRDLHQVKIDYAKLLEVLAHGRDVAIAKAYLLTNNIDDVDPFKVALQKCGWDVAIKEKEFKERIVKNSPAKFHHNTVSWDVGIALDIMQWASKLDCIILVSGNGVFVELFNRLKFMGVHLEVAGFSRSVAQELRRMADDFIDLSPDPKDPNTLSEWLCAFKREETQPVQPEPANANL